MSQGSGHQRAVAVSSSFCVFSPFAATTEVVTTDFGFVQRVALVHFLVLVLACPDRQGAIFALIASVCARCSACIFRGTDYRLDSVTPRDLHRACSRRCVRPRRAGVLQWLSADRIGDS